MSTIKQFGKRSRPSSVARTVPQTTDGYTSIDQPSRGMPSFKMPKILAVLAGIAMFVPGWWAGSAAVNAWLGGPLVDMAKLEPAERKQKLEELQTETAVLLKKEIPMKVDSATTLIAADAVGPKLRYSYQVKLKRTEIDTYRFSKSVNKMVTSGACRKSDMRQAMEYGALFEYVYYDSNKTFLGRFVVSDSVCSRMKL